MPIRNIDVGDVQQITSGQVIIDLVSIVKELVENAIDSGSTKVDVTYSNNGLDYIKIEDDGSGIEEEDFRSVCLRHHTSKLVLFEGLSLVNTLGFRGEALSSLCTIAELSIRTCAKRNYPRYSDLSFDSMGNLIEAKKNVGGLRGTVVTVKSLFRKLPVRRKTLEKNIKREFQKSVNNLICYILIHPEIRFTVYNVSATKKKQMLIGSQGKPGTDLKQSLLSVYGSNGAYGLDNIDITAKEIEVRFKLNVGELPVTSRLDIRFEGLISDCSFGMGRSAADRQFVYFNKRPVDSKRLIKTINEVYRTFNAVQFPVILLNIVLDGEFLDINVTPDKRTVIVHNEDVINDVLREELSKFYESRDSKIPVNIADNQVKQELSASNETRSKRHNDEPEPKPKRSHLQKFANSLTDMNESISQEDYEENIDENDEEQQREEVEEDPEVYEKDNDHNEFEPAVDTTRETSFLSVGSKNLGQDSPSPSKQVEHLSDGGDSGSEEMTGEVVEVDDQNNEVNTSVIDAQEPVEVCVDDEDVPQRNQGLFVDQDELNDQSEAHESVSKPGLSRRELSSFIHDKPREEPRLNIADAECEVDMNESIAISIGDKNYLVDPKQKSSPLKRNQTVHDVRKIFNVDLEKIKAGLATNTYGSLAINKNKLNIDNIEAKQEAEEKLVYLISKQDFTKMKVVGQFNLGFILVTLNGNKNLFIIDQHASDEKYNFERLTNSTKVFHSQKLVIPRKMELNALDEMTVMSNLQVFATNGFGIQVDENERPGHRVQLTSLPVLRSTVFDESDFHELIHLTNQAGSINGHNIKCSKIRTVLALRSCRSSIMIGQHLSTSTMRKVVNNLGSLDKPWNCPHGRPTLRHITDLKDWSPTTNDYYLD